MTSFYFLFLSFIYALAYNGSNRRDFSWLIWVCACTAFHWLCGWTIHILSETSFHSSSSFENTQSHFILQFLICFGSMNCRLGMKDFSSKKLRYFPRGTTIISSSFTIVQMTYMERAIHIFTVMEVKHPRGWNFFYQLVFFVQHNNELRARITSRRKLRNGLLSSLMAHNSSTQTTSIVRVFPEYLIKISLQGRDVVLQLRYFSTVVC